MPDFDLTGEHSLIIELHMLRPITEKVHSGNGPVSLVLRYDDLWTDLANGMLWLSNTLKRRLQKCYEMKFRRCEELWMQLT